MSYHAKPDRILAGAVFLAVVATMAACGDPNFFGTDQEPPEITAFAPLSETVSEGDSLYFDITATGNRRINRLRLELTGAITSDQTINVDDPTTSVEGSFSLVVPNGTPVPQLNARAWAIDVADDTSEAATAAVTVQDATPPTISASPSPGSAGAGQTINIDVNASDARGLAVVQVAVSNNVSYDSLLVDTITDGSTEYSQTWQLVAPAVEAGTLTFVPSAVDVNDLTADGDTAAVEIGDRTGPVFLSLETLPDSTIPLSDSVRVTVTVRDPAGLRRVSFIGLSNRGDPQAGTDSVVERFAQKTITFPRPTEADTLPKQYTLYPYLLPTDNETTEPVEIIVVAEDSIGNVSDTTKFMYVGGPDVNITYPPDGFAVGVSSNFDVRMRFDDGTGIDSAKLIVGGDASQEIDLTPSFPARTDTAFVVAQNVAMPSAQGVVTLRAVAWNTAEVLGQSRLLEVDVLATAPSDTTPPIVSVSAQRLTPSESGPRMELLDELRITVSAFDGNAGLERIGLKIVASRGTQQDTVTEDITGLGGSKSLEELVFQVPIDSLYALFGITGPGAAAALDSVLPENLDLRIHGFAADTVGEFACSVGVEEQRDCDPATYSATGFYEAGDTAGLTLRVEAVRGVTVLLDKQDAIIADLAIDTVDERLFLSNVTENLVEFLQLDPDPRAIAFENPVQVGSEPIGLFLGDRVVAASEPGFGIAVTPGDTLRTLLVANSGGTNMSLVHLEANAANVQEVDVVRLRSPNATLFQMLVTEDENGFTRYQNPPEAIDLADRPQFLAQDSLLRVVFSTRNTSAAELTTVRYAHLDPDPGSTTDGPEAFFMLTNDMVDGTDAGVWVIGNVDAVDPKRVEDASDSVRLISHKPGYPGVPLTTPFFAQIEDAYADLVLQIDTVMTNRGIPNQAPMFRPFVSPGTWDFDALGWGDTTFISASGDRGKIAVGEGATSPTGRIMIWHGYENGIWSDDVPIADLVNNASEVVLGVGLNGDGSLGVARGNEATYFFTPDLRLQGLYRQTELGGAGATFHPEHDDITDGGHTDTDGDGVAFTGTSEHSIDVVNTFHFNQVNRLVIRDNIVGPLRAGPPLGSDNAGLTCPTDLDCVVVKVYGITSAGGVVIVNVRRRDLEPYATP